MMKTSFFLQGILFLASVAPGDSYLVLDWGDFSKGLTGWTVESGNVIDGGGYALFQEDPCQISSLCSPSFTLPLSLWEKRISFDLIMSTTENPFENAWEHAWHDAFTVSLLDPNDSYKALISNAGLPDFYYTDTSGVIETITTISSNRIHLQVHDLQAETVVLAFDFFPARDGMLTSFALDNITVELNPAFIADLNVDGRVNLKDFAIIASHWREVGCADPNWCDGADLNKEGNVDTNDLILFLSYWLEIAQVSP
jgi:hypothetical protein